MKKIIKAIKDKIDWIMIIMGSCLASYSLLDFKITRKYESSLLNIDLGGWPPPGKYYYTIGTQIIFAVGMALIIWGILLYKEKAKIK